jgi:monoterpene epsilon-lactone hydrolase
MASLQSLALRALLRLTVKPQLARHANDLDDLVATWRRLVERNESVPRPIPNDVRVVPVDEGGVRGEWVLRRGDEPRARAILYVHGGATVTCRPHGYRAITVPLARATATPVFVVDYRHAPEAPFPAALDDVVAAYDALRARIPASAVVVVGDSAGGNLALASLLALRARDGAPRPYAGVVALSPWTDLTDASPSVRTNADSDDLLIPPRGARIADAYAPRERQHEPLVSPVYGDYAGGPPMLVFASTIELLRDDARRLVDRARAQGAHATLVLEPEMPHVWPLFPIPEARATLATIADFCARAWRAAERDATV